MRRSKEKGQVLMEFVVCLIPIILVFSGLILVAVLGRANVQNTIKTRSAVDLGKNMGSAKAEEILTWDYGKDEIPFSADDTALTGANSYYIANDLDTSVNTVPETFKSNLKLQEMYDREFVSRMPGRVDFTKAADLVGAKVEMRDVLSKKKLKFFERMFHLHLKSFHVDMKDTSFMPEGKSTEYEIN